MAEGARLLSECAAYTRTEGSNPSLPATTTPVHQDGRCCLFNTRPDPEPSRNRALHSVPSAIPLYSRRQVERPGKADSTPSILEGA